MAPTALERPGEVGRTSWSARASPAPLPREPEVPVRTRRGPEVRPTSRPAHFHPYFCASGAHPEQVGNPPHIRLELGLADFVNRAGQEPEQVGRDQALLGKLLGSQFA